MTELQELILKAKHSIDFAVDDLTNAHGIASPIEQMVIWSALQDAHELRSMVSNIEAALTGVECDAIGS